MHRFTTRFLAALAGSAVVTSGHSAWALDKYLDLEPPETRSGVGYGYHSTARKFVLQQCVDYNPKLATYASGSSGAATSFSVVTSRSQIADEMGLSVGVKFAGSLGFASGSTSEKIKIAQKTSANLLSKTILASYKDIEMNYISGEIKLKPEYLALLSKPGGKAAFKEKCGDYLIVGQQEGRWMFGTASLVAQDTKTMNALTQSGNVSAQYGTFSGGVDQATMNALESKEFEKNLTIQFTASDVKRLPENFKQFREQALNFPLHKGNKGVFKLKAVPFDAIVANWPTNVDPLAPLTSEDMLDYLADVAYGLIALEDDTDFVIQHADQFALGTTAEKRNARRDYLKKRRAEYQSKLDELRNRAKDCDVVWSNTCGDLYAQWAGKKGGPSFEDYATREYGRFPVRYLSDCAAPRWLNIDSNTWAGAFTKDGDVTMNHLHGDKDMGGGPIALSAHLSVAPNFTGGNPLATRKLRADLIMYVTEMKDDHSSFHQEVLADVFDLDAPAVAISSGSLAQCAYRGRGVQAKPLPVDGEECRQLKSMIGAELASHVPACAEKVESKWVGILKDATGKDPDGFTFSRNARGVMSSLHCSFGEGSRHGVVKCNVPRVEPMLLDLVNTNDVQADAWHENAPPSPAYAGAVKKKRAKGAQCRGDLVEDHGECVPKPRR